MDEKVLQQQLDKALHDLRKLDMTCKTCLEARNKLSLGLIKSPTHKRIELVNRINLLRNQLNKAAS
jgi:hypothetical protein